MRRLEVCVRVVIKLRFFRNEEVNLENLSAIVDSLNFFLENDLFLIQLECV